MSPCLPATSPTPKLQHNFPHLPTPLQIPHPTGFSTSILLFTFDIHLPFQIIIIIGLTRLSFLSDMAHLI